MQNHSVSSYANERLSHLSVSLDEDELTLDEKGHHKIPKF